MIMVCSIEKELCSTKDSAAANEDRFQAEISTVSDKKIICLCNMNLIIPDWLRLVILQM